MSAKRPTESDTFDYTPEESLEELRVLARSAGARVIDAVSQSRIAPDSATLIGAGKLEELCAQVKAQNADVVLFDEDLSPTQQRNLERALQVKVVDRTQLILDIFASRARTREGQLQVELAQLQYMLPRLAGRGISMTRQGGGIGTRGPGETQLESDRRRINKRVARLKEDIENVRGSRKVQRRLRQAVPLATVALVGYTNAGKSTLFNRLTGAGVLADAKMFATLDPTVRAITLPSNRRVLMSDTVGFIRSLPTTLVNAFRATLEEVVEASVLLHVIDASSHHAAQQTAHVRSVLEEIGADATRQVLVWNKMDQIDLSELPAGVVPVSALKGTGFDGLLAAIDRALPNDPVSLAHFRLPVADGASLHVLHQYGKVLNQEFGEEFCEVKAEVPESIQKRLAQFVIEAGD